MGPRHGRAGMETERARQRCNARGPGYKTTIEDEVDAVSVGWGFIWMGCFYLSFLFLDSLFKIQNLLEMLLD